MNPELSRALVQHRIADIKREAGRSAALGPPGAARTAHRTAPRTAHRPQLRSRIGFALVEAGLRLLADRSGISAFR